MRARRVAREVHASGAHDRGCTRGAREAHARCTREAHARGARARCKREVHTGPRLGLRTLDCLLRLQELQPQLHKNNSYASPARPWNPDRGQRPRRDPYGVSTHTTGPLAFFLGDSVLATLAGLSSKKARMSKSSVSAARRLLPGEGASPTSGRSWPTEDSNPWDFPSRMDDVSNFFRSSTLYIVASGVSPWSTRKYTLMLACCEPMR
mmetsp:Transcript_51524/g.112980  ORF Transcript_51524/g.112980 Transcript_51524/m.112980 type:complete len:208 (-) Transcript_51524:1846-2469(-)